MRNIYFNLEYLSPTGFIGFWVLFIGLIFTGIMFYFVFFRLSQVEESYNERESNRLKKANQKTRVASLYPKEKKF
tara:strand:+ start:220 stop:444 length:225 start_codon:yes stop_codon:yes gene_type:complete